MPEIVTCCPTEKPCAALVVIVTVFPASAAPVAATGTTAAPLTSAKGTMPATCPGSGATNWSWLDRERPVVGGHDSAGRRDDARDRDLLPDREAVRRVGGDRHGIPRLGGAGRGDGDDGGAVDLGEGHNAGNLPRQRRDELELARS